MMPEPTIDVVRDSDPPTEKEVPLHMSAEELARLRQVILQISDWMDARFEVPLVGWRFGLDALLGLVPGVGDAATTLVSLYLVALAGRCGLPRIVIARMALNVAADMLLGSLPLVGDLFDVWWKANQRNANLLAQRLDDSKHLASRRGNAGDWLFVGGMLLALIALFAGIVLLSVFIVGAFFNGLNRLLNAGS